MTRNLITLLSALFILMLASLALAQDFGPGQGSGVCQFIDEDGDGFNDLAPDADGDGIPNGLDEDFVKPEDGTGNMYRKGQMNDLGDKLFGFAKGSHSDLSKTAGLGKGQGYGVGDGTGTGVGPGDGTGFGPGTGDCPEDASTASSAVRQRGGRR